MNVTIGLNAEEIAQLDAVRGELTREQYVHNLVVTANRATYWNQTLQLPTTMRPKRQTDEDRVQ